MTDIVKWLRMGGGVDDGDERYKIAADALEAKDKEIERLRRMMNTTHVILSGDGEYWKERAERAEAERDKARKDLWDAGLSASEMILELTRERDALRPDAERYRWMKENVKRIPPGWSLVGWDAAIDAARKEGK